jgi:hypothetical protein
MWHRLASCYAGIYSNIEPIDGFARKDGASSDIKSAKERVLLCSGCVEPIGDVTTRYQQRVSGRYRECIPDPEYQFVLMEDSGRWRLAERTGLHEQDCTYCPNGKPRNSNRT